MNLSDIEIDAILAAFELTTEGGLSHMQPGTAEMRRNLKRRLRNQLPRKRPGLKHKKEIRIADIDKASVATLRDFLASPIRGRDGKTRRGNIPPRELGRKALENAVVDKAALVGRLKWDR